MDPTVTGGLFALAGVGLGAALNAAQYFLTRRDRIRETLRTERQARYTDFISLADSLLMALEADWHALENDYAKMKTLAQTFSQVASVPEPEQRRFEAAQRATVEALERTIEKRASDSLRVQADAVRAARIQVEIVGSTEVARQALHINQQLYELLGSLSETERLGDAVAHIGDIRATRLAMLESARREVQLNQLD